VPRGDRPDFLRFSPTIAARSDDESPLVAQPLRDGILATLRHLRARGPPDPAHERPSSASPPRGVEENDRVRPFEANVERLDVVAVEDPGVARNQRLLLVSPFVFGRVCPARLPVLKVEVDQRKASPRCKCAREGALAGSCESNDNDTGADRLAPRVQR